MKRLLILAILAFAANVLTAAPAWQPAGEHIRTRWAAEVGPKNALPEYPRPQMQRRSWKNLNGLWDYAITPDDVMEMPVPAGEILVPFALESSLSGVGQTLKPWDALWYRRTFRVPLLWRLRKTVLLHFGAVDYACEVWLNGEKLGEHRGGYTAFEFDVTKYLKKGRQTLILKVLDGTDNGLQPRGKQVSNPDGIWYTAVSGIWQTVWLEAVSRKGYIKDYDAVCPDLQTVSITPYAVGAKDVKVELLDGGKVVAEAMVKCGKTADLKPAQPHLWTPDDPHLYGLRLTLQKDGRKIDKVEGYTAIRTISKKADAEGHLRLALNDEILFQYGPLDQGWWPDGLYTAPTDEALEYDLVKTKEYGFNMLRKHIKVEPDRWYAHCDRLGILVWQDMPCTACYDSPDQWAQGIDVYDAGISASTLDKEALEAACKEVNAKLGRIDILINCAGGNSPKATCPAEQMAADTPLAESFYGLDIAGFKDVFDLNFQGTILATMVFTRDMASDGKGGSVLNISSMNSYRPLTKIPAYSAAKGAINNFTQWYSVHVAQLGIRCNAIAPGFFLTDQNRFLLTDEATGELKPRGKKIIANTPVHRFGNPEDLVGTMLYLLSDISGFVTGVTIPVDGGYSAFGGV
jgi:NAD(P)-dependent dehydrogenase (short-subunit alcohol dehydrogenase family)